MHLFGSLEKEVKIQIIDYQMLIQSDYLASALKIENEPARGHGQQREKLIFG